MKLKVMGTYRKSQRMIAEEAYLADTKKKGGGKDELEAELTKALGKPKKVKR